MAVIVNGPGERACIAGHGKRQVGRPRLGPAIGLI
jgi:hypothetical protein